MFNHSHSSYFQKANKNRIIFTLFKSCLALAFGVPFFFLSGCKSAELRAVENSASILQLKTGREIERYVQDLDPEWMPVVSKSRPEVTIRYEPINNYTTKEVFDEIVAILIKNNWKEVEGAKLPGYFRATLQQQGHYDLHADVVIDSNKNIVSIHITSPVTSP